MKANNNKKSPNLASKSFEKNISSWSKLSKSQLLDILDGHDCHAGPEDGCECQGIWDELFGRGCPREVIL